MEELFSPEQCDHFIQEFVEHDLFPVYSKKNHCIYFEDSAGINQSKIYLPIQLTYDTDRQKTIYKDGGYLIIVIQSSHAVVAYGEDDIIFDHKVFSSYMVRQKQGKSQIKYLKTKGKSRAGSRVRLSSTLHFFENICQYINYISNEYIIDTIALSCSKTLYHLLFNASNDLAFNKEDPRIISIPLDLDKPNSQKLHELHQWLTMGKSYH